MANRESRSSWKELLLALRARSLHGVERVVADDHAGWRAAIREGLAEAAFQRCYVHTIRTQSPDGLPGTVVAGLRRWTQWDEMTDLKASVAHDDALDDKLQDGLVGASRRQMKPDHRLQLDHACGDLDQAKAQGVGGARCRPAPRATASV